MVLQVLARFSYFFKRGWATKPNRFRGHYVLKNQRVKHSTYDGPGHGSVKWYIVDPCRSVRWNTEKTSPPWPDKTSRQRNETQGNTHIPVSYLQGKQFSNKLGTLAGRHSFAQSWCDTTGSPSDEGEKTNTYYTLFPHTPHFSLPRPFDCKTFSNQQFSSMWPNFRLVGSIRVLLAKLYKYTLYIHILAHVTQLA